MKTLSAVVLLFAVPALAREQALGFTLTGPTVAPGVTEVVGATTPRFGRPNEFLRLENNFGFGYGFSATLEAQALIVIALESTGLDGRAAEGGGAARLRWQPLDGQHDALGFGVTATVGVTTTTVSAEARLSVEKWVGALLLALNASLDYRVRNDALPGPELHLEQSGGLAYRLANGVTAGFEVRNRMGFEQGAYFGAAISMGPVLGWRGKSAWASLALLPQVAAVKAESEVGNGQALELRDNERVVMRLQAGVAF